MSDLERASRSETLAFWDWFASIASALGKHLDNDRILEELDRRVLAFGRLTWEVGPGERRPNSLTISPGGNKMLLPLTESIVGCAPSIDEWEFHCAKPAKNWDLQFELLDSKNKKVNIDARDWRYILLRYPDKKFDVIIQASNLPPGKSIQNQAGSIVVEGQLGERLSIQYIDKIELVEEFDSEDAGKSSQIQDLPDHFRSLIRD